MSYEIYYGLFNIDFLNIIIGIFFITIILVVSNNWANKNTSAADKLYFKRGLLFKLFGAIFYCMYHQFVYKGGDTLQYYANGHAINQHIGLNIFDLLSVVYKSDLQGNGELISILNPVESKFLLDPSLFIVLRFSVLFSIASLGFNSYYANSLLFALMSFLCAWRAYRKIASYYQNSNFLLAFSFLFSPSIIFWGSSVSKDTLAISSVLLFFSALVSIVYLKKSIVSNIVIGLFSIAILTIVKSYIAACLMLASLVWVAMHFLGSIKTKIIRLFLYRLYLY
jgi:hypothetical protein